jgi:hypothetical protein
MATFNLRGRNGNQGAPGAPGATGATLFNLLQSMISPLIFASFEHENKSGGGSGDSGGLESCKGAYKFISCVLHATKCPFD